MSKVKTTKPAEGLRFYLETSERSMETHAVLMPENGSEAPQTVCGHDHLTAEWWAVSDEEANRQPWPSCETCYRRVILRKWFPWNVDPEAVEADE